jgi:hypothetical protein
MRISLMIVIFIICHALNTGSIFAGDNPVASKPSISILPSKYVSFTNTNLAVSNGLMVFNGSFIIFGQGVYGHFDLVVYSDSGKVTQKIQSDDRAWRKERGSRVKSISLSLGSVVTCYKIEVSFHEMRTDLNSGIYLSN